MVRKGDVMAAKLVLMIGIPGSGKSTYAKRRFMGKENAYISRDEIRFSMVKEDEEYFSKEKEVFNEYVKQVDEALCGNYRYVIADATHLNKASRDKLLNRLTNKPKQIVVIYMDTPLMLAIMRNNEREGRAVVPEKVIRNMYDSIQLPTAEEDIDLVTIKTEYNGERGEYDILYK